MMLEFTVELYVVEFFRLEFWIMLSMMLELSAVEFLISLSITRELLRVDELMLLFSLDVLSILVLLAIVSMRLLLCIVLFVTCVLLVIELSIVEFLAVVFDMTDEFTTVSIIVLFIALLPSMSHLSPKDLLMLLLKHVPFPIVVSFNVHPSNVAFSALEFDTVVPLSHVSSSVELVTADPSVWLAFTLDWITVLFDIELFSIALAFMSDPVMLLFTAVLPIIAKRLE